MCGIVGFLSAFKNGFDYHEAQAFRDMVVIDTLRGYDSTGVFGVDNLGNVGLLKAAMTGAEFVRTKEYDAYDTKIINSGVFAVGHNRWATRGVVNDKNAHPFCVDDKIFLVQNGTYKGDHRHHADTEVDTEAIAHVLAQEDDVETALQSINASYALVWYNTKNKTLYMIRNTERPLYIAYTRDGGTMFASEKGTIMLAAMRNDIVLKGEPYMLKEGCLVTHVVDPDSKMYTADSKEIKYSFRYKWGGQVATTSEAWYNRYPNALEGDDLGPEVTHLPVVVQRQIAPTTRSQVDRTVAQHALDGTFNEYATDREQCEAWTKDFSQKEMGKKVLMEVQDILPCNTHSECQSWIVYGRNAMTTQNESSPLYYFMLFDKPKEVVQEMASKEYFWAQQRSMIPFTHRDHKATHHVTTVFCIEPVCATNLEASDEIQTH